MSDPIEDKLDQILATLNRIDPPVLRLGAEEQDGSIRLLAPSDIAYIISKSEDDRRRQSGDPAPPEPTITLDDKGDDSQVVYAVDGKTYRTFATLADLQEKFAEAPSFLRSHRAYLISMDRVSKVKTIPGGRQIFFDGVELYALVSDKNVKDFESYLRIR